MREIGDAVGLASPSSVHAQLATLEARGFLRRDPTKPRALELSAAGDFLPHVRAEHARHVPLVGEIAAGGPIIAEQTVDAVYPLPRDLVGEGTLFMLKVRGDSMIEDQISDGDYVVVHDRPSADNGEMVIAMLEDSGATVKRFFRERDGRVADARPFTRKEVLPLLERWFFNR